MLAEVSSAARDETLDVRAKWQTMLVTANKTNLRVLKIEMSLDEKRSCRVFSLILVSTLD